MIAAMAVGLMGALALLQYQTQHALAAGTIQWTGAVSTDWATPGNWNTGVVPTASDVVVIDGGTNQPTLNLSTGSVSLLGLQVGQTAASTLTISNGSLSNKLTVNGDVAVGATGTITHPANTTAQVHSLVIEATGNFTVASGGKIDANNKGYAAKNGPGAGGSGASGYHSGAGHGGNGVPVSGAAGGQAYGNLRQPTDLGSGGGNAAGGGAVRLIITGSLQLNGAITVDGASNGGAGGSIWVNVATFTGSGSISANGGAGTRGGSTHSGPGGGGRVALYFDQSSFSGQMLAASGLSTGNAGVAGAGTIYSKASAVANGDLVVDSNGQTATEFTPQLTNNATYDNFTATRGAHYQVPSGKVLNTGAVKDAAGTATSSGTVTVEGGGRWNLPETVALKYYNINHYGTIGTLRNFSFEGGTLTLTTNSVYEAGLNNMTIGNGATITHPANATSKTHTVNLDVANDLTIVASGKIDVSGKGYTTRSGPGAGGLGSNLNSGAAHGGNGGDAVGLVGGKAYDSVTQPSDLGSGGSAAGGGAVRLNVGRNMQLDGSIVTNGISYGGAGGSVWLTVAGALTGAGNVSANGGASQYSNPTHYGGGGGGRIAIYHNTSGGLNLSFQAIGGSGPTNTQSGGAGTIYTKTASAINGDLRIDQNSQPTSTYTPQLGSVETYDTVTITRNALYHVASDKVLNAGTVGDGAGTGTGAGRVVVDGAWNMPETHTLRNYDITLNGNIGTLRNPTLESTILSFASTGTVSAGLNDVVVGSGGVLTHHANTTTQLHTLNLSIGGNLTVQTGGKIDVSGKGYQTGSGPGAGKGTVGGDYNATRSGGGYGGNAFDVSTTYPGGRAYGSVKQPADLGSGGAANTGNLTHAPGGGVVKLAIAGVLTVDGSIQADGAATAQTSGGSGGSVWLTAPSLRGGGSITANGANGGSSYTLGGGGGGRIAVYYDSQSFTGTYKAAGGAGSVAAYRGGAGTIYVKASSAANGTLTVDNNGGVTTAFTPQLGDMETYDTFTSTRGASYQIPSGKVLNAGVVGDAAGMGSGAGGMIVGGTWNVPETVTLRNYDITHTGTIGTVKNLALESTILTTSQLSTFSPGLANMTIGSGSTVTHPANDDTQQYVLDLAVSNNLTIAAGGTIDLTGKGYAGTKGPGAGLLRNGNSSGGGGYGANGGDSNGVTGGTAYGSVTQPTELGSGGGSSTLTGGGSGGGAVKLTAGNTLTVNGTIVSHGTKGKYSSSYSNDGGSGSGGSIWLAANTISGSGAVSANGGAGYSSLGGAGAGGRVAIYSTNSTFTGTKSAFGGAVDAGAVAQRGAAGTVYVKSGAAINGDLIIDNNGLVTTAVTPQLGVTETYDNLLATRSGHYLVGNGKTLSVASSVQAAAGSGANAGQVTIGGTVKLPANTTLNGYVINNNSSIVDVSNLTLINTTVYQNGSLPAVNLTVDSGATMEYQNTTPLSAATLNNLTVKSGGNVTHKANTTSQTYTLNLTITGALDIQAGGKIDVSGKGFASGSGPGAGGNSTSPGGGGYGSTGGAGAGSTPSAGGAAYGSVTQPVDLGSGGGYGPSSTGGSGGGAVKLSVGGSTTVAGSILADGAVGTNTYRGGGSGGSIWVISRTINGTGVISAKGGAGNTGYGGGGAGGRIAVNYTSEPLRIDSVAPNRGSLAGGDTVILSGASFSTASEVKFGSVVASGTYQNSTTMSVTAPAGFTIGPVDVTVTNYNFTGNITVAGGTGANKGGDGTTEPAVAGAETAVLANGYTYAIAPPTITSISPTSGPTRGGTEVTITGQDFSRYTNNPASVDNTAWSANAKTLPATLYSSSFAVIGNKMYLFGGTSSSAIYSADVADPTTWTNTGKTLPTALGESQLAIIGNKIYLFGGTSSNVIYSADVADPTTWTNTGKTLPTALGESQLAVVGDKLYLVGGRIGGVNTGAIYSATVADPTTWTDTGKVLPAARYNASLVTVRDKLYLLGGFGANNIYSATVADPTTWTDTGKVLPSALSSSQLIAIGDKLYLFGGTISNTPTNAIYSANVADPTTWMNTGMTIPSAIYESSFGVIGDKLYLFGGRTSAVGINTIYEAPLLLDAVPSYNKPWVSTSTYINPTVRFGAVAADSLRYVDGQTLVATAPAQEAGVVDVTVTNPDGQVATFQGYTYLAPPSVTSITPNTGSLGGGDTVTISGAAFSDGVSVRFGNAVASNVVRVNATTLTVTVPGARYAGPVDVTVINGDGQTASLAKGYAYTAAAPVVTSVTPNEGPVTGGTTVTLNGSGFTNRVAAATVAAGNGHTCSVSAAGEVFCWGINSKGQLGDGTTTSRPLPARIEGLKATAVSAGSDHTCAIANGEAYCWGYNLYGQLGDGSTTQRNLPTKVMGLEGLTVTAIAAGEDYSCAVASGEVYCWGGNGYGRLGDGTVATRNAPVKVGGLLSGLTATIVSVENQHTCAVANGEAYCWGRNTSGELGTGNTTDSYLPVKVSGVLAGVTVSDIAVGNYHTCAVANGEAYCWGQNVYGQLGDGSTSPQRFPTKVQGLSASVSGLAAGYNHACAVSGGAAYCWGYNGVGQLGDGTIASNKSVATAVTTSLMNQPVESVAGGFNHSCAVTDGEVYCWGDNGSGRLGDGTSTTSPVPVKTAFPETVINFVVKFGDVVASVTGGDSSSLRLTSPAHVAGAVDISLSGTAVEPLTLASAYTYREAPSITSVTPNSGPTTGGDSVTIFGQHFSESLSVKFGTVAATDVVRVNDTTVTVTVPAASKAGAVDVVVTNSDGQAATATAGYMYLALPPSVTSLTPSVGPTAGGTVITITGSGFARNNGVDTNPGQFGVTVGGQLATNVTYVSPTQLKVTTPAHFADIVDVKVTNYDGQSATLVQSFKYVPDRYAFTNAPLNIHATEPDMLTIEARDASNQPITSPFDITLSLKSSSSGGQFAIDINEDPLTRWDHTSVVLPAGKSSVNVYYRDSKIGTPTITVTGPANITASQSATILPANMFKVTGITDPVRSGVPSSVTVAAVDYMGNPDPTYTGTVSFSSTDLAAVIPGTFTFTPEMRGVHTFVNGVTMVTQGEWCVSAKDVNVAGIEGSQCNITVTAPAAGTIARLNIITAPQSFPADKNSSAITVQTQDTNGTPIPVATDTTIYVYSSSASGQFSLNGESAWAGTVPFPVMIKAGTTSANVYYRDASVGTFTLTMRDDAGTGTDFGWTNATQSITVGVGAPARLSLTALDPPVVMDRAEPVKVTLRDNANRLVTAMENMTVYLTSSVAGDRFSALADGNNASASLAIVIPAGASEVTAYYLGSQPGSAQLAASDATPANGVTGLEDGQLTLSVAADVQLVFQAADSMQSSDTIPVQLMAQRRSSSDPVTLAANATINLSSTAAGEFSLSQTTWRPIRSVTIPAGQSSVSLYYRNTTSGAATITGTESQGNGWGVATKSITVLSGEFFRYGFTSAPSTSPITEASSPFTVSPQDIYGNVVPVSAETTAYLYTSGGTGRFAADVSGPWNLTSLSIPTGGTAATFYYQDTALGSRTITVSDSAPLSVPDTGIVDATKNLTVTGQDIEDIHFVTAPQTVTAGEVSDIITVETRKADGSPARVGSDTRIYLNRNSSLTTQRFKASADLGAPDITYATIPAGQYSTSFYYSDTKAGNRAISVEGSFYSATQITTVEPAAAAKLAFTTPQQRIDQNEDSAQIRLSVQDKYGNQTTAPSQLDVRLVSSCASGSFSFNDGAAWQSVTELTIPAGAEDAFFYYKDSEAGICQLTAEAASMERAAQLMTVDALARLVIFETPAQTFEAGQTVTMRVGLRDQYGNAAVEADDRVLYLYSSSASGRFLDGTRLTIPAGRSSASFTYQDTTPGSPVITTSDSQPLNDPDTGLMDATQQQTVIAGQPAKLALTPNSQNLRLSETGRYTIHLQNLYGVDVAASSNLPVYLHSTQAGGVFSASTTGTPTTAAVTIPAGAKTVDVYYRQTTAVAERATLTASDTATPPESPDTGLTNASASAIFMPDEAVSLSITSPAQVLASGQESAPIRVAVHDTYGNEVIMGGGLSLYLSSTSSSGKFENGKVIYIPVGASSTTFRYTDTTVGSYVVTVADRLSDNPDAGLINATQTVDVEYGAPYALAFDTSLGVVERGGVSREAAVTLRNAYGQEIPAQADLTATLNSSSPSGQFAPSTSGAWSQVLNLTIPAGQSRASFYYRDDLRLGSAWLTATDNASLVDAGGTIYVTAGEIVQLAFTTEPQSVSINRPTLVMRVEAQNRYGKPVSANNDTTLHLRSSSAGGKFSATLTGSAWDATSLVLKRGSSSINFYYRDDRSGTPTLVVGDNLPVTPDSGWINASQSQTILATSVGPFHHFLVTNISDPQQQGNPSSVVVVAQDINNNVVESYSGTISFSSSDPTAIIPGSYTFDPYVDKGIHTFTNGVAFRTPGEKVVTVTDTEGKTGSQVDITVLGSAEGQIERLVFIEPRQLALQQGEVSSVITIQAQSVGGAPVNAGPGGMPVRLSSSSTGGEFALTPDGPWQKTPVFTISEGINWLNLHYRDTAGGSATLTGADWLGGRDDSAIDNAVLQAAVATTPASEPPQEAPGDTPPVTQPNEPAAPLTPTPESDEQTTTPREEAVGDPAAPTETPRPGGQDTLSPPTTGGAKGGSSLGQAPVLLALRRALASPAAPVVIPTFLYALALLLIAVLLKQIYNELSRVRYQTAILKRQRETAEDKQGFLTVAAHYLRTPVAAITGSVDVLKLQPDQLEAQTLLALETSAAELRRKSENIITQLEQDESLQQISEPNVGWLERQAYRSPLFWLPVGLTIGLTLLGNWAINAWGGQAVSQLTVITQLAVGIVVAVLLYGVVRSRIIQRQKRQWLDEMMAQRARLDAVKNDFIRTTYQALKNEVAQLLGVSAAIGSARPAQQILHDNILRIARVVAKFEVLAKVDSQSVAVNDFAANELLAAATQNLAGTAQSKAVQLDVAADNVWLHQDKYLLSQAIATALDNAIRFSPEGKHVKVSLQTQDDTAIVSIHDHGPGFDRPSEELFAPFHKSTDDLLVMDDEGLGLGMYLQKVIVRHLGGEIVARNRQSGGAEVVIKLPLVANTPA